MTKSVKRVTALLLAVFTALAALVVILPVNASAVDLMDFKITYSAKYVKLTLTPQDPANSIYFTTDGTKPTTSSQKYMMTLGSTSTLTIRAAEFTPSGVKVSSLKAFLYAHVAAPTITGSENGVTMSTLTPNAQIRYTTDGSEPTENSALYTGKVLLPFGSVIKARAYKTDCLQSGVVEYDFSDLSVVEEEIYRVNLERKAYGLSALTIDSDLTAGAEIRAKEAAVKFEHVRPNGQSCYSVLAPEIVKTRYLAENLAYSSYYNVAQIVENWMNSPTHRANILTENYSRIGVAVYYQGGLYYWSQFFSS